MNNQWKDFLQTRSARIDESGRVKFDQVDSSPDCALFDLSHLSLIRISGDDAADFLQGQLTNDIRDVDGFHSQLSAYCTPKGRMLANFRVIKRGEEFFLQLPPETHSRVLKRLPMFVLMSKAAISDASNELVSIGISGDCAKRLLEQRFTELPTDECNSLTVDDFTLVKLPGTTPRWEIIGLPEAMPDLWDVLAREATAGNIEDWALMDIQAGIPTIREQTIEAFVPQMTNMHLIGGVSFTKGCYTGQEVVARMKYLGKLKRRMHLAHVETTDAPQPGDTLYAPGSDSGQGAGRVVDAMPSPEGGFDLLAVVEISSFEADNLHLGDASGPQLNFRSLPYAFEEN